VASKRMHKGIELVANGHVKPIDSSTFSVKSETDDQKWYIIKWHRKLWECSCEDFKKHNRKCKHIYAVLQYLSLQDLQVGVRKTGSEKEPCPNCGKTDFVIRDGFGESRRGFAQRFFCKKCRKGFSAKTGFEGAHGQAFAVVVSLDLYYRGVSLRQIQGHFESVYGIKISHGTVYGWIKNYVGLVSKYLEKDKVDSSGRWHGDETCLRVKGKHLILWSLLDSEKRLLLAKHISEKKSADEAIVLFNEGLKKTKNAPSEIITDAAATYIQAIDQKFGKELHEPVIHVQSSLSGPITNNKLERYHRTLKQRFKTVYALHSLETAKTFTDGFNIFYNNVKKHRTLGTTPAEASGLNEGTSWAALIKKAKKQQ
jgi:putative transposase